MYSELARRETFNKWPHMNYKWALPEQMAQAGFYHQPAGTGDDRALCFTCNVCLVCWEPTDEPWYVQPCVLFVYCVVHYDRHGFHEYSGKIRQSVYVAHIECTCMCVVQWSPVMPVNLLTTYQIIISGHDFCDSSGQNMSVIHHNVRLSRANLHRMCPVMVSAILSQP